MAKKSPTKSTAKKKSGKSGKKVVGASVNNAAGSKESGNKKPTLASLLKKQFDHWQPEMQYRPEPDRMYESNFAAPPAIEGKAAKQVKALLVRQFDLSAPAPAKPAAKKAEKKPQKKESKDKNPETAEKPAPPKKQLTPREILGLTFETWKPENPYSPGQDKDYESNFAAPPAFEGIEKALLLKQFDLSVQDTPAETQPADIIPETVEKAPELEVIPEVPIAEPIPEPAPPIVAEPAEPVAEATTPAEPPAAETEALSAAAPETAEPAAPEVQEAPAPEAAVAAPEAAAAAPEAAQADAAPEAPAPEPIAVAEVVPPKPPSAPEPVAPQQVESPAPEKAAEPAKPAPAPEPPKPAAEKPVEKAVEKPKSASPEKKTPEIPKPSARETSGGGSDLPPQPPEPTFRKEEPRMNQGLKMLILSLGVIFVVLISASISNMKNYYVMTTDKGIEIWRGDFSPRGKHRMVTLYGAEIPENAEGTFGRKQAFSLAFDYYMNKANALAVAQDGLIDFKAIIDYLDEAEEFAVTGAQREKVNLRLEEIDFMMLMYKADVAAEKMTDQGYKEGLDFLKQAKELDLDSARKNEVTNKIREFKAALESLESKKPAPMTKPKAKAHSAAPAAKPAEKAAPAHH